LSLTITVASESGAVRLVLAVVSLGASPDPEVETPRSTVASPLPVETFERSGEDPPDAVPTVTVVCGTLALADVPVVVAVTDGAATVAVVPLVETDPLVVVTVAVVSVTVTVPLLSRVVDTLASLTLAVVSVDDAVGALAVVVTVVLPLGSLTTIGSGVGPGSAKATLGPLAVSAAVSTATATVRINAFICHRSLIRDPGRIGSGTSPARTRARAGSW